MPVIMDSQVASATTPMQELQVQEVALVKQLSTAEASLKSYQKELATMSSSDRELNILVQQNRQQKVVELRGDLDRLRQQMSEVKAGVPVDRVHVVAGAPDGLPIVLGVPPTTGTVEAPHFFGLEPRQFREPALFILLLPLVLALSRWIWRRTPSRARRESALEGSPQITRLELAVESIAIEVERIGEAQRFTAKLLAERPVKAQTESVSQPLRSRRPIITPLP